MELRLAELEDLRVCANLSSGVSSSYVWQLAMSHDAGAVLADGEFTISLRCLRLPRPVDVKLAGEPLETLWDRAEAVFVAADEDLIGGFVALTVAEERPAANVARLIVAPEYRRRGIGTSLIDLAGRWAVAEGFSALTAHCSARNHPAVAFYMRRGITFAGYSEGFYPRGEVALFWQRGL